MYYPQVFLKRHLETEIPLRFEVLPVLLSPRQIKNTIQKNKFTNEGKIAQENFYDNNEKLVATKKYTVQGALKEETYILERYPNGNVKRDYIRLNGEEKGKLRTYNSKKVIISQEEK